MSQQILRGTVLAAVLDLSLILDKFCTLHVKVAVPDNSSVPTDTALIPS